MPQNEYIEESIRRHGRRLDHEEKTRKRLARLPHKISHDAKHLHGIRAKMMNKQRRAEKISMKKTIKMHEEKDVKERDGGEGQSKGAVPTYLLDREEERNAKALSSAVKEKRKDRAARWAVPLPKVKAIPEDEVFRVQKTGKHKNKSWKRMITKMTFVPETFTRSAPKFEHFIRPSGLRVKKANVTHPELKTTFQLPILGVKRNPQNPMYTGLGVLTKGTVIEVDTSILGVVTPGGKIVISKYAQVTNNPENDGCVNAVLLISS